MSEYPPNSLPIDGQETLLILNESIGEIEGKILTFRDLDNNKETPLKISKIGDTLGNGSFGEWVKEVTVEFENDTTANPVEHHMVLKKYFGEGASPLLKSYTNYTMLKKASIPTWTTYRINQENNLALMTNANQENGVLVTANGLSAYSKEKFEKNPITVVQNMHEFVDELVNICNRANEAGYRLRADTWGVLFTPDVESPGKYTLSALIADLDNLETAEDPYYVRVHGPDKIKEKWKEENSDFLFSALVCIYPSKYSEERLMFATEVMSHVKQKLGQGSK